MHDQGNPSGAQRRDAVDPSASRSNAPEQPGFDPGGSRALREMLRIAIPSVATMTSYTVMSFMDKLMVKDIGPDPTFISAQSNGAMLVWMSMAFILGLNGVINSFVSQNLGADKPGRGAAYAWNGLWLGLVFYVLLMLPMILALPHLYATIHAGEPLLVSLETKYATIMMLGGIFTISARSVHHYFYGMHRPNVVLISAVAGNIVNIVLNAVLIFGDAGMPAHANWFGRHVVAPLSEPIAGLAGALGVEPMGIAGAALATVIGGAIEFMIPFLLFVGPRYARLFGTRHAWRVSLACLRDLLRVGLAPGLMFVNEIVCWAMLMMWLIPRGGKAIGDDPILHNTVGWIALQYMHLSFMPAVGISIATQAMVGKAMGMGRTDIAVARTRLALKVTVAYMGLCALCFVLFRSTLIEVFINPDTDPAEKMRLIEIGSTIMIAAAVFQIFDAVAITTSAALRGAGDTVWPGVATIVLSWVCIPGVGLLLIRLAPQLGSIGPWIGASLYIIALGVALSVRFLGGRWKTMSLVDKGEGGARTTRGSIDLDPMDELLPDPTVGTV